MFRGWHPAEVVLLWLAAIIAGLAIGLLWAKEVKSSTGFASWYGPGLYGNRLGCGGRLSPGTWGVAHKFLPCGTRLTICFKRCARARVIDRGPYVRGRDFDLTSALARYVGLTGVRFIHWYR